MESVNLAAARWVAFDVETTGLYPASGRVVEFGAIKFGLDGRDYGIFQQLVSPQMPIPPVVTRIHGITDAMVQGQPTSAQVLPAFLEFLGDADALLAHNASFDTGFIDMEVARAGLSAPLLPILDTVTLARRVRPGLPSYRLETLARSLGVESQRYHRAMADSTAVRDIFCRLLGRLRGARTLGDLAPYTQVHVFQTPVRTEIMLPPGYEPLGDAMKANRPLEILYSGGSKGARPRTITPLTLFRQAGVLYVSAYCHVDRCDKNFRLDRIRLLLPSSEI